MKIGIISHPENSTWLENETHFDAFELRFDLFSMPRETAVEYVRLRTSKPLIFTLRSQKQGGAFSGDPTALLELANLSPDYLDVEWDTPVSIRDQIPSTIRQIISYHNTEEIPASIPELPSGAWHYKIACRARSTCDTLRLILFAKKRKNMTAIAMGEYGKLSRLLIPPSGLQFFSFDSKTNAGQLSLNEYEKIYRLDRFTSQPTLYGLIGDPVTQSPSHYSHNAVFRSLEQNALYIKLPVKEEEVEEFLDLAQQIPFEGLSITMPLKTSMKTDAAVNTAKLTEEGYGFSNTDGVAAVSLIQEKMQLQGLRVCILGTGGSAEGIGRALKKEGASVQFIGRTPAQLLRLQNGLKCSVRHFHDTEPQLQYDCIISTLPFTLQEGEVDFNTLVLPGKIAFEVVHTQQETPFLKAARRKNCSIIDGMSLFQSQAAYQFSTWFPQFSSEEIMGLLKLALQRESVQHSPV